MEPRTNEEHLINVLRSYWVRHPDQLNEAFASDAELIRLADDLCLACTTDTLQEEISLGILQNPWTIGWTAVSINLSDLAAVGAEPRGILLAWTVPQPSDRGFLANIARGVADACRAHGTALLGGDLNEGPSLQICGTAFGVVPGGKPRQRVGMRPGDRIFVTGPVGIGNALALAKVQRFDGADVIEELYRPTARFDAGPVIRDFAGSAIDTSDGLLASIDVLARLNSCGIVFRDKAEFYHPEARTLSSRFGIPLWLFAGGEHGEFELVFSVPAGRVAQCLDVCRVLRIQAIEIGEAIESPGVFLGSAEDSARVDLDRLRTLSSVARRDPRAYLQGLLTYANELPTRNSEGRPQ